MQDIKLIISFDENYAVSKTTIGSKDVYSTVTMHGPADKLTFGGESKERVKAFANAIATDDWVEYNGRQARSHRPESRDPFYQFLNHKLTLIYEDDRHLVYHAAAKPRRKSSRQAQPEQPQV